MCEYAVQDRYRAIECRADQVLRVIGCEVDRASGVLDGIDIFHPFVESAFLFRVVSVIVIFDGISMGALS
jgi:hypothetical protein